MRDGDFESAAACSAGVAEPAGGVSDGLLSAAAAAVSAGAGGLLVFDFDLFRDHRSDRILRSGEPSLNLPAVFAKQFLKQPYS